MRTIYYILQKKQIIKKKTFIFECLRKKVSFKLIVIDTLIKSKKNDLEKHICSISKSIEAENLETLKLLGKEYIKMVNEKAIKNTITRKFFIVFFAEINGNRKISRDTAVTDLMEKTSKVKLTLEKCGNEVIDLSENNFYIINNLYKELNRNISEIQSIEEDKY